PAVDDDVGLVNGEDRVTGVAGLAGEVALRVHRDENRCGGDVFRRDALGVLERGRAPDPRIEPESMLDVEEDPLERPAKHLTYGSDYLGAGMVAICYDATPPVGPALTCWQDDLQEGAEVVGEAEAMFALDVLDLGGREPGRGTDAQSLEEICELLRGSSH